MCSLKLLKKSQYFLLIFEPFTVNGHLLLKPLIALLSLWWCLGFRSWFCHKIQPQTPELPCPFPCVPAYWPGWCQGAQSLTGNAIQRDIWDVVRTPRSPWVPLPPRVRDPARALSALSPFRGLSRDKKSLTNPTGQGGRTMSEFTGPPSREE